MSKIDPTVPLGGLPLENVETAEWVELTEEFTRNGETFSKTRKVAKINGITMFTMMPDSEMRKFINFFPRESVYIPETTDEARNRLQSGNGSRAVEVVNINGAAYSIPKGIQVQVPAPVAQIVRDMLEPFRTPDMIRSLGKQEFIPLGDGVSFD